MFLADMNYLYDQQSPKWSFHMYPNRNTIGNSTDIQKAETVLGMRGVITKGAYLGGFVAGGRMDLPDKNSAK